MIGKAVYKSSVGHKYGYYTVCSNKLVWELTYEEYYEDMEYHSKHCARRGWRFTPVKLKLKSFA